MAQTTLALGACACCLLILFLNRKFHARQSRIRQAGLMPILYERQLDEGEDYFSAIQAPNKPYEWPWLKDGTFYNSAAADAYGSVEGYTTYPQTYSRRPWDEFGDHAYDVDMRVADDCYDQDPEGPNANTQSGWDCYREVFDPRTGYAREEPAHST